jgi:hypothetical protein
VAAPEQAVVHQQRVGRQSAIAASISARLAVTPDTRPYLGTPLDLQAVRPIILEALHRQQRAQVVRSLCAWPLSRPRQPHMRRLWLIFSQAVTVALALLFVVATLKPEWLRPRTGADVAADRSIAAVPASAASAGSHATGSLAGAARRAAPAVVSIAASKAAARSPHGDDPGFRFFFGMVATRKAPSRSAAWARA